MANISISTISLASNRRPAYQEQYLSLGKMLVLHLLPGILITAFMFLIAPFLIRSGFPPVLSLYLAILLVLVPFELGFLFYQGKRINGRCSLEGVILLRKGMPIRKMIFWIILLFILSGFIFTLLPQLDNLIAQTFFAWFPNWSFPNNLLGDPSQYSKAALWITIVAGFLLNGIAGPVTEELYFRGYLLPRIPASKRWAPLINVLLFSLYHFFSPWQNITRILAFFPLGQAAAWKRNVYLSMAAHCLLNIAGMVIALAV